MARKFKFTLDRKLINALIVWNLRRGGAPGAYFLLTVPGRKSGRPHSVPIVLVEWDGRRWLAAPYGVVDWVRNARAAGRVKLTRSGQSRDWALREVPPEAAAPVLKQYLKDFPITAAYFDARADAPVEEFVAEARTRPVFELLPVNP